MSADPAGPRAARGEAAWETAWSAALADLELAADEAERVLTAAHLPDAAGVALAAWAPPVGLPPLPASLRERAAALLDRQLDLARRTAEAARMNRRHQRAVEAMRARPAAVPVYVDAQG